MQLDFSRPIQEQYNSIISFYTTLLDLSENKLGERTCEELAAELALIPSGVTYLDLRGNELDSMDIKELILALTSIPNSVKKVSLGLNTRPTQRSLEEQNLLRHALSEKGFCLEGNGSDLQPSSIAAVDGVIPVHPLQDLIYSYLSQPGETLPTRPLSSPVIPPIKPQSASQSGQSLLRLQHGFFNESYHSPSFKNKLGIDNDRGLMEPALAASLDRLRNADYLIKFKHYVFLLNDRRVLGIIADCSKRDRSCQPH